MILSHRYKLISHQFVVLNLLIGQCLTYQFISEYLATSVNYHQKLLGLIFKP